MLGDAGYKIWRHLLTPFPESDTANDRRKRRYNYQHSVTRIVVERAFGILKNWYKILLEKIQQKSPEKVSKLIFACAVLHNLLVKFSDTYPVSEADPLLDDVDEIVHEDVESAETANSSAQGLSKRNDLADIF